MPQCRMPNAENCQRLDGRSARRPKAQGRRPDVPAAGSVPATVVQAIVRDRPDDRRRAPRGTGPACRQARPDLADDGAALDRRASLDAQARQVAVQRIRLLAVIDDDELAEPREGAGEDDAAGMEGANGAAVLDAIVTPLLTVLVPNRASRCRPNRPVMVPSTGQGSARRRVVKGTRSTWVGAGTGVRPFIDASSRARAATQLAEPALSLPRFALERGQQLLFLARTRPRPPRAGRVPRSRATWPRRGAGSAGSRSRRVRQRFARTPASRRPSSFAR